MSELTEKELKNTINVDGQEYNINAKTAEIAKKVENKLVINRTDLDGNIITDFGEFDGSSEETVTIVSATYGGRFQERIAVPADTRDTIDDEAVLNYGDIRDIVVKNLINTSVLYIWSAAENKLNTSTDDENAINSISIVKGTEDGIVSFADSNWESGQLPVYFYVSDSKNIYFGTAESSIAIRLAVNAEKLIGTLDGRKFELTAVDIEKRLGNLSDKLDNITSGEIVIPKADKANQSASAANAETATNAVNVFVNEDKTKTISGIYINDTLNNLIDGTTLAAKAGDADTLDGKHGDYFQTKIKASTSEPKDTEGHDGDVWIVYKATT